MKYAAILLTSSVFLGGCGGCGGDDPLSPDGGDPDAGPGTPGDPTTGAWRDGFSLPGVSGFGARVEAIALDGGGDVYAAGIFTDAAGLPVANVARWDGGDWVALGDGLDGWVRGLGFDGEGTLWAGVTVETQDGLEGALLSWNGSTWTQAGTLDGAVRGLAIVDAGVVVVGDFATADGVDAASVALYDGSAWSAVGDGTISGAASAVAADPAGFCVAGQFDVIGGVPAENAACWNGTLWTPLGVGLPGGVAVLARAPGGTWYAGGTLTFTVDPSTGAYEAGIAALNGATWEPFEGGIDNGFINEVRAIAFDGADLLVGGHFLTAGDSDVFVQHLARWSPTGGWSRVGGGLTSTVGVVLEYLRGASDIVVGGDGTIWVGGIFTRAGATPAANIVALPAGGAPAALVGSRPVRGIAGLVDALAADGDDLIAGGWFPYAGQTLAENLARFDGTTWTELGGGIPGIVYDVLVRDDGTIAVAGDLLVDGDQAGFAVLDGGEWTLPGGRVTGLGLRLIEDDGGALWLGGDFLDADGTSGTLFRLAGTAWEHGGDVGGRVSAMAILDGELAIGGLFPGAVATRGAGGAWTPLGGGVDGEFDYENALAVSPSLGLVAGGAFDGIGGEPIRNLARWDGEAWTDVGAEFTADDFAFISAVLPYGDGLFVAGGFAAIGGVTTSNLGWYDGAAWHDLDGGLADLAEGLTVIDDVLYVGGPFTEAGARPASGIAAWDFASE